MPTGKYRAFELLTVGMEELMAKRGTMWEADPAMRNWLLGMMVKV